MAEENEFRKLFLEWLNIANQADHSLYYKVLDYEEEYFPDMTFKPKSSVSAFVECEVEDEDGKFIKMYEDPPLWLSSIQNAYFRYFVKDICEDFAGQVNSVERTMTLSPDYANDTAAILHEMIHVYETSINESAMFFHDILVLCLYNDLKPKINDLDERIIQHTHLITGEQITAQGGSHDILFFLKSLDLDLRCGYKLGTVCGYGRDK